MDYKMELNNNYNQADDRIQVIDNKKDTWSIIREITRSGYQEDAFYICNISDIINQHENWKITMPRVEPHYAVKCNDTKVVLEVLAGLGTGFDCASMEEIRKVIALGVSPDRIIFANPAKKASHIKYAAAMGVTMMTFDNEKELYKIKRYYQDARMVIRIRYDDLSAICVLGNKYGCDHKTEAAHLLRVAQSLGINVIGVSFHIGSGSKDISTYAKAIEAARYVFDVAATMGFHFNFLDIGGGFPGGKSKDFQRIGRIVNAALHKYFPDPNIRVISEPGRYYVTSAFTLTTNIHSIKDATETDPKTGMQKKLQMYYVDVSVYGAFISILCDEFYKPQSLDAAFDMQKYPSIVWGATCDGVDKIADNVMLPVLEIGDWMVFEEAGAYTLSISSRFNGFPTPDVHCIVSEDDWKLLQRLEYFPKNRFVVGKSMKNLFTGLSSPIIETEIF